MPRSLTNPRKGDRYLVQSPVSPRTYEAVIVSLDGQLVATVDYAVIGPVENLPVPWCDLVWEKQ